MTGSLVWRLILTDLYLLRWWSVGTIVAGLVAAAAMWPSEWPVNGGGVLMICAIVILNIFLVMTGVVNERKERVSLFVLTFPVSRLQYVLAKVAANAIAFVVPWTVLSLLVVVTVLLSPMPDGYLTFWTALLGYLLAYYLVLLAVGLNTDSTGWHAAVITAGNVSVNFLIMLLFSVPSIRQFGGGPTPVWAADVVALTVGEIALGVAALVVGVYVRTRRPDFP